MHCLVQLQKWVIHNTGVVRCLQEDLSWPSAKTHDKVKSMHLKMVLKVKILVGRILDQNFSGKEDYPALMKGKQKEVTRLVN